MGGSSFAFLNYTGTNRQSGILLDESNTKVVEYTYDAWGKPTGTWTLTTAYEELAKLNPFRYRGYVWDEETGLYYLRSRYYNPEWGRFVNADAVISVESVLLSTNCYAYCCNNPTTNLDQSGMFMIPIISNKNMISESILKGSMGYDKSKGYDMSGNLEIRCCSFVAAGLKTSGWPANGYHPYRNGHGDLYEWWMDSDGRVIHSRHHSNHGNSDKHPLVPHDHNWHDNNKGDRQEDKEWTPPDPRYQTPSGSGSEKRVLEEAAGIGAAVWLLYRILGILLGPSTGGASYVLLA